MSLAIFEVMDNELSKELQVDIAAADGETKETFQKALVDARSNWRKLADGIAKGVIEHIKTNMEIQGVKTEGKVSTIVKGTTGPADPYSHQHSVDLSGKQTGVEFTQSNDGTGLVK